MDSRLRRFRAPVAVVATTALVALSSGSAIGEETRPVEGVVDSLRSEVRDGGTAPEPERPKTETPETEAPADPEPAATNQEPTSSQATGQGQRGSASNQNSDGAEAKLVDVKVGDQEVLGLGHNKARIGKGGRSQADSTLLAIGGQEIIGTRADSDGEGEGHAGDPLAPLCEGSGGGLCLRLLYADAWAEQNGRKSRSRAQSGVANVCLGGSSTARDQACDGPVAVGLLESEAEAERDDTGRSASAESHVADVCLGQDAGSCAIGAELFKSESHASSDGEAGGDAAPLALQLGGEGVVPYDETFELGIPDCEEPVVCLRLNEDGVFVGSDGSSSTHDGAILELLDGTPLEVTGLLSHTGASAAGGAAGAGGPDVLGAGGPGRPGAVAAPGDAGLAGLPNTGGVWSGLLALAMLGTAAGGFLVAYSRRRSANTL